MYQNRKGSAMRPAPCSFLKESDLLFKDPHNRMPEPTPDVDHIPVPPDADHGDPIIMPPDQPGLPEEDQPEPTPKGDPPSNEPTRLVL